MNDDRRLELILSMAPEVTEMAMRNCDFSGKGPSEVADKYAQAFEIICSYMTEHVVGKGKKQTAVSRGSDT